MYCFGEWKCTQLSIAGVQEAVTQVEWVEDMCGNAKVVRQCTHLQLLSFECIPCPSLAATLLYTSVLVFGGHFNQISLIWHQHSVIVFTTNGLGAKEMVLAILLDLLDVLIYLKSDRIKIFNAKTEGRVPPRVSGVPTGYMHLHWSFTVVQSVPTDTTGINLLLLQLTEDPPPLTDTLVRPVSEPLSDYIVLKLEKGPKTGPDEKELRSGCHWHNDTLMRPVS